MKKRSNLQLGEEFLQNISKRLGRGNGLPKRHVPERKRLQIPQINSEESKDDLINILEAQCEQIHVNFIRSTTEQINDSLLDVIKFYKAKSIVTWEDKRFNTIGLGQYLNQLAEENVIEYFNWEHDNRDKSIERAERADIGITFSDLTLAESATVTLFNDAGKGRSVSLLPKTHIAIVPKSSIVYRLTDAVTIISKRVKSGENIPSCINFISGPSNSADIEMNLVVGVHGPLHVAYIVVEDM